tara:strand:- start:1278 stop:1562 length:285 start_codon:yes stop_codon:yes gene_type:complete
MPKVLDKSSIETSLTQVPNWRKEGNEIRRTFEFSAYLDGISFVDEIAKLAEQANHHPDIDIRWRKVHLALTTHSAGGLTHLDFDLAAKIDTVYG